MGVVRLDVGGGRVGGNAKIIKFRICIFFHAATMSAARQRVASTRKREATSRQLTEGPLKLTVEAAGWVGRFSISLSLFFFASIRPTRPFGSSKRSFGGF